MSKRASLFKAGISYFERNLLMHPFCFFALRDIPLLTTEEALVGGRKRQMGPRRLVLKHEFADPITGSIETWTMQPDIKRGWLTGMIDSDVLIIIKRLLAEAYEERGEFPRILELPSWREMCRMMNIDGKNTNYVRDSVQKWAATVFETTAFYVKSPSGKLQKHNTSLEDQGTHTQIQQKRKHHIFTLWNYYEQGELYSDGTMAESVSIEPSMLFLESLKSFNVTPFDDGFFWSLSPLAKRIYLIQGIKFFGLDDSAYSREDYLPYCAQLPLVPRSYMSQAKQSFHRAHSQLSEHGFLEGVEWIKTSRRKGNQEWHIRYYPGTRAKEETNSGRNRLQKARRRRNQYSQDQWDRIQMIAANLGEKLGDHENKNRGLYTQLGKLIVLNKFPEAYMWGAVEDARARDRHGDVDTVSGLFYWYLKDTLTHQGFNLDVLLKKLK